GIPTWSPTVVLICRSTAYVWQSGRDAQFSADCGRMCLIRNVYRPYQVGLSTITGSNPHLHHRQVSLPSSRVQQASTNISS
ncbi:hypothetical protein KCU62_g7215, partial [Aureobasidium sp. EXF-3399]